MNLSHRLCIALVVLGTTMAPWPVVAASAIASIVAKPESASTVEVVNGSNLKRITLSQRALERLAIKTAQVERDATGSVTAPYGALLYDGNGKTWAYTNPQPRVYVRSLVVVDSISGGVAYLKDGPPVGTTVVVVGAAELHGIEAGVGH